MVQQPVANRRLVNISRFGIINFKRLITTVLIGMISKVAMKRKNIVH